MTIAPQLPAAAELNLTLAPHCGPDVPKPVPVWSCGPVDSGSPWRLPIALGRPLAVTVDISAVLAALPGRVIELVTVAEQTLTALRAVVVRTHALLGVPRASPLPPRASCEPPGRWSKLTPRRTASSRCSGVPNHQPPDRGFAPLSQAVYPRIRRKKEPEEHS